MKYGIYLFATDYCVDIDILAYRAEALGFDSLWVPEHPIVPRAIRLALMGVSLTGSCPIGLLGHTTSSWIPWWPWQRGLCRDQDAQARVQGFVWSQSATPCDSPRR